MYLYTCTVTCITDNRCITYMYIYMYITVLYACINYVYMDMYNRNSTRQH